MKNTKKSITVKVLFGYLLLTAFAAVTVFFVYQKIVRITDANKTGNVNNQKLFLISEAVTNLYTAEGISRDIIQNDDAEKLPKFNAHLDTISNQIDSLKLYYDRQEAQFELDSIKHLLVLKKANLIELLDLRRKNKADNYYDRVLNRLTQKNYLFEEEEDYEERFKHLKPYQRKVMVDWLKYAKEDNAQTLTQQSADSLINSMKTVLIDLETEEHRYQASLRKKENELLENDRNLSAQLRNIRSEIEREEMQKSVAQVSRSQKILKDTSQIIIGLGIACLLTIAFFVILIVRDTKTSQQYRERLEEAKSYSDFLLKTREQLMATVTHDLRSPLNTIAGYSDMLHKTKLSDKQSHYLEQLKKSSAYILRLVNDLLDLSKLEAGKMSIEKLPFNPKNLLNDAVSGVVPSEDPKQLEVILDIEEKLDHHFLSDPFRIFQILTNLIGNAYKFTEKGTLEISARLDETSVKSKKLEISVRDTGIGISEEQQEIIFEEFSQAKASIEKQYGGSGLGLAITKKLVSLLGGAIALESEPEKGSKFTVLIPVENAKATYSEENFETISIKNPNGKKILIVDDEITQRALTSEVVANEGFAVESAPSAAEALKITKKGEIDLILSDIQMPKVNGFQFLRKLKKNKKTKGIPVVALSGRTEIDQKIYTDKGFETNIIKPFHASELLEVIARILELETDVTTSGKSRNVEESRHELYDLEDLKVFTDGDHESLQQILKTFAQNSELNRKELLVTSKKNDKKKIAFVAHKMLPMFRQLKAKQVILPLEKLEQQHENHLASEQISDLVEEASNNISAVLEALPSDKN